MSRDQTIFFTRENVVFDRSVAYFTRENVFYCTLEMMIVSHVNESCLMNVEGVDYILYSRECSIQENAATFTKEMMTLSRKYTRRALLCIERLSACTYET